MADYVLSAKADSDLSEIYLYSYLTFGEVTADTYWCDSNTCPPPQRHARA